MPLAQPTPQRTYIFQAGQAAVGDQVNKEFDTLYGTLQGGIGDAFIASNASISGTKLAAGTVPPSALVPSTATTGITDVQVQQAGLTAVSLATGAVNSQQFAPLAGSVRLTSAAPLTILNNPTNKFLIPSSLLTLTCAVPSVLLVTGTFDFDCNGGAVGDTWVAELLADGAVQAGQVIFKLAAGIDRKSVAGTWAVPLSAGSHKVQLDAYCSTGTSGTVCSINAAHTGYTYLLVTSGGK